MLELRAISKRLGAMAMREVSLSLGDGEYFVLLGPSGVGKTVLIELIAGLMKPDAGRVFWNGVDITAAPPEARGFAVVYQDCALFPHLTVADNIAYGLRAAGAPAARIRQRQAELADLLGIAPLMARRPETLSGGEAQRVALARAMAVEPKLLLLDEPLSALDTTARLRLRRELRRINATVKMPILHVTHDLEEAMALGDRVCVMLDHRIGQTATPEDLFRRPSDPEVAAFLGLWNVLPVTAVQDHVCTVGNQNIHVSGANDQTAHVWIKPEEILLSREPFDSSARNQFACRVLEWQPRDTLLLVRVQVGELTLAALITYASFSRLALEKGAKVCATFKSSAVHCF